MQTQRVDEQGRLFLFFTNSHREEDENIAFTVSNDLSGREASVWDAESGEIKPFNLHNGIHLGPSQSLLLCISNDSSAINYPYSKGLTTYYQTSHELNNWDVTIGEKSLYMDTLKPLPNEFGGTAIYKKLLPKGNHFDLLDLGHVEGVCEVWLNGKYVGTKWYGERVFNIKSHLHHFRRNILEVRITTTLGNSLQSMTDNPAVMKWFKGRKQQPFYPQGLLGPVILLSKEPADKSGKRF